MSIVTEGMYLAVIVCITLAACYFYYRWYQSAAGKADLVEKLRDTVDNIVARLDAANEELRQYAERVKNKDQTIVAHQHKIDTLTREKNEQALQLASMRERLAISTDNAVLVAARLDQSEAALAAVQKALKAMTEARDTAFAMADQRMKLLATTTTQVDSLLGRANTLEAELVDKEYQLKQYAQVVTDPKSMKEFITWQSQRRQQDELLNLLTGQSSSSQPVVEESQEMASRTDAFTNLEPRRVRNGVVTTVPPIAGLMPVIPEPSQVDTTTVSGSAQTPDTFATEDKYSDGIDISLSETAGIDSAGNDITI